MSSLKAARSGEDLIEGDPSMALVLSEGLKAIAVDCASTATQVSAVACGPWHGKAASVGASRLDEIPRPFTKAARSFSDAANALAVWSTELRRAQALTDEAIAEYRRAERRTGVWICDAPLDEPRRVDGPGDPGRLQRDQAERLAALARREVDVAAQRCADALVAATAMASDIVGFWRGLAHHGGEAATGLIQAVGSLAHMAAGLATWLVTTRPDEKADDVGSVVEHLRAVASQVDNPLDALGLVTNWDTFVDDPDRWAGELLLGGGFGKLAKGSPIGAKSAVVTSRIGRDRRLIKEAIRAGKSDQAGLDRLVAALQAGNLQAGIGPNFVKSAGVRELRTDGGARIFVRQVGDTYEILAKSTKKNQRRVINILEQLYG